jgi:leucyl/phenylalanyl-tRNA--protein transferase
MPIYRLDDRLLFPPAAEAEDGLLAVGGDLRPERLVLAYSQGIFPWYEQGQPILWHSPDPRMVLLASQLHVPRSLGKTLKRGVYTFTLDRAFADVIAGCAAAYRPGQRTTWITPAMRKAYLELHRQGLAHSVEAWTGDRLVGGLYGVCLGGVFFGESMFTREPDASKAAFVTLVRQLLRWDIELIDSQVYTDHLARFGAEEWPRRRYLRALAKALQAPTRQGRWSFDAAR